MKIKIIKVAKPGEIMGQPPKNPNSGKMDSQIFIGKEDPQHAFEKRKKDKKKKKKVSLNTNVKEAKHGWPMIHINPDQSAQGIWEKWKSGKMDTKAFVDFMVKMKDMDYPGLTGDEMVREGINKVIESFKMLRDYEDTARALSGWLEAGKDLKNENELEELASGDNNMKVSKKKKKKKKKKKEWDPNPWAVCEVSVGKKKDPEKFERCVKKVKKQQASFNLNEYRLAQKEEWRQKLINKPETGMGYQIADVTLLDGTIYKDVTISNGKYINEVPGCSTIPFGNEEIADVNVTHNKMKTAQVEMKDRYCEICKGYVGKMSDKAWIEGDKLCSNCQEKQEREYDYPYFSETSGYEG